MSTLEDLLPELAGVFAAQESAMENVVSMLTTQVAQLIQENERQSHRVASLESTQQQLQEALLTIRKAYYSLEDHQKRERIEFADAVGGVASSVEQLHAKLECDLAAFDTKLQSVRPQHEPMSAGPSESQVVGLINDRIASVESKLAEHTEHRVLEMSNKSNLQIQQTEQAMMTELEMLEKKFDYLSRVKMEIKDLSKKIEKQDQTMDDMRMGMELLAKSIGTDEDDASDSGNTDRDEDPDGSAAQTPLHPRVTKAEVMNVMRRISLSSADIQAKIDKNAAALLAEAAAPAPREPIKVPPPTFKSVGAPLKRSQSLVAAVRDQQAHISRSKTLGPGEMEPAPRTALSVSNPPATDTNKTDLSTASDSSEDSNKEPVLISEVGDDTEASAAAESVAPSPEDTAIEESWNASPEDAVESSEHVELLSDVVLNDVESDSVIEDCADLAECSPAAEPPLEDERPVADVVSDLTPEKSPEEAGTALEEQTEQNDQVVDILPSSTSRSMLTSRELQQEPLEDAIEIKTARPGSGATTLQHTLTTPNLTTAYPPVSTASTVSARSRRTTRLHKGNSSQRLKETTDSARSGVSTPLTKETVKELWHRVFARFVQFKRLQMLNGTNPDRIFRKQNISVGARVKRLEESTNDLEESIGMLEGNIKQNSEGVQVLTQMLAQSQIDMTTRINHLSEPLDHLNARADDLNARIDHLNDGRIVHGQMIVGLEEKLDLVENDLRRVRGSNRRGSSQTVSSITVNALATQQQELSDQLASHVTAFETVEHSVKRLCELDLPALTVKIETTMRDFRGEQTLKSKEFANDFRKTIDRVNKMQTAQMALQKRTDGLVGRLYQDIMTLSKAHLVSLEMVRGAKTQQRTPSDPTTSDDNTGGKKSTALFDVSLDMLTNIYTNFRDSCEAATNQRVEEGDEDVRAVSPLSVLLERTADFHSELEKLKVQAEKAKHSPVMAFGSEESNASSSNFLDRLALVTNAQLRALESIVTSCTPDGLSLQGGSGNGNDDITSSDVSLQAQDLVVQLRAVSSLLSLHSELLDPHQRLRVVLSAQDALQKAVRAHDYSLAQFSTLEAIVKMMHSRLDTFLEISFEFAKDEDVKKSIQDMLSSSETVRDNLSQQLEAAHLEAQQRDEMLERELTQLVARVNKKLDKDELLWTQDIIERQLQSVAKSSLGESDLVDIHRLLRSKLDKSYFNALLLEQRNRAAGSGGGGTGSAAAPGSAPLISAKCISCNSEIPPTKAMIKSIVKEQVQQEVHKTLARQQQPGALAVAASSSSFNASTHRSMDKYKKELMAAAAQSPQKPQVRR